MGVIRRQSIKHTAVNLVGLIVGACSTLLIYPHVLETYGLVQYLLNFGIIGLPLLALGSNSLVIRFFPRFQDKNSGHHGFLPLLLLLCALGCLTACLLAAVFWEFIQYHLREQSPLQRQFLWMAAPLAFFYVNSNVMSLYSANFKRIVVPSLLLDFSQKLIIPALFIAVWKQWLSLEAALWLLILHAGLSSLGIALYLRWLGEWHWKPDFAFITPELRRDMLRFLSFGMLGGFALLMASRVDLLLVGSHSALAITGVYGIATYFATAIEIPIKSLYTASASSVMRHLTDENWAALGELYQKVSINLLLVGILFFGAAWISIDSIYALVPNGRQVAAGKYVFFFLGLARIVEMTTGLNNNLVYFSRYYGYTLISLCVIAVANVSSTLFLIPKFGIIVAALAALLSVTCYNGFTVWLVWKKFRLFPFSRHTLAAIGLGFLAFGLVWQVPRLPDYPFTDLVVHSGLYTIILVSMVLAFRVSPDLNEMAAHGLQFLRRKMGK